MIDTKQSCGNASNGRTAAAAAVVVGCACAGGTSITATARTADGDAELAPTAALIFGPAPEKYTEMEMSTGQASGV